MVTFLKKKRGGHYSLFSPPSGTLEPHLSALLWMAMLVSLAIVIVLPQPHGIRALIASTILRLIFSVGLEPTLFLLGAFNVSISSEPVHRVRWDWVMNQCNSPADIWTKTWSQGKTNKMSITLVAKAYLTTVERTSELSVLSHLVISPYL